MKKNLVRLFTCAVAAACMLSLAACNSGDKTTSSTAGTSSASVSSAAESSGAASSDAASTTAAGKFATVEDFVNSDILQSQLESMKSSMGSDGLAIDVTGEGNKLIYTFTYSDLGDTDVETLKAGLESALDQMSSTFEGVASSLKEAVEIDNPVVVVTYVGDDGTELCSKEFSAAE